MKLRLADHSHDPELRRFLRTQPMPGWVRVAYCREPDFFQGLGVQGTFREAIVAEHNGEVLGFGCRATKPMYINGRAREFGYLSGLRSVPQSRAHLGVFRGYRFLKELHADARTPAYLTTIMEENEHAKRILTSGKAGLPRYLDHEQFVTAAIQVGRRRIPAPRGLSVRRATDSRELLRFLQTQGVRRQFFPALDGTMFGTAYLRGLNLTDFLVATDRSDKVLGVLAIWDQSAFKQNVVNGYNGLVAGCRPALNLGLRLAGMPCLPRAGEALRSACLSFVCVANDDVDVLVALINHAHADAQKCCIDYLIAGFHERDPLAAVLDEFRHVPYRSRLYLVCWDDGLDFCKSLDPGLIPHLEVASLS